MDHREQRRMLLKTKHQPSNLYKKPSQKKKASVIFLLFLSLFFSHICTFVSLPFFLFFLSFFFFLIFSISHIDIHKVSLSLSLPLSTSLSFSPFFLFSPKTMPSHIKELKEVWKLTVVVCCGGRVPKMSMWGMFRIFHPLVWLVSCYYCYYRLICCSARLNNAYLILERHPLHMDKPCQNNLYSGLLIYRVQRNVEYLLLNDSFTNKKHWFCPKGEVIGQEDEIK